MNATAGNFLKPIFSLVNKVRKRVTERNPALSEVTWTVHSAFQDLRTPVATGRDFPQLYVPAPQGDSSVPGWKTHTICNLLETFN